MKLTIDQTRLVNELETLGAISEAPPPVTTRVVFTEADLRGRGFVKQLCRDAGLVIREDPIGNTFARWAGAELVIFTSEEPTRFGIGCMGSRLLSGLLDVATAEQLKDRNGASLEQARTQAGFAGPLSAVRLPNDYYSAFVELHIEQGPILEARKIEIGVVTAIAAPASLRVWIEGEAGHAGAVLMPDRRDAFLAAGSPPPR